MPICTASKGHTTPPLAVVVVTAHASHALRAFVLDDSLAELEQRLAAEGPPAASLRIHRNAVVALAAEAKHQQRPRRARAGAASRVGGLGGPNRP